MGSLTIDVQNKEEKTLAPDFWDDTSAAEAYIRALQPKKQWLSDINQLTSKIDDLSVLVEFSKSGDDVTEELNALFVEATSFIEELEFKNMLSEEGIRSLLYSKSLREQVGQKAVIGLQC